MNKQTLGETIQLLFCQQCQALQKVMELNQKPCWYLQRNRTCAALICATCDDARDTILQAIRAAGYVQLADDQELPETYKALGFNVLLPDREDLASALREAGFRKVQP